MSVADIVVIVGGIGLMAPPRQAYTPVLTPPATAGAAPDRPGR